MTHGDLKSILAELTFAIVGAMTDDRTGQLQRGRLAHIATTLRQTEAAGDVRAVFDGLADAIDASRHDA